MHTIICQRDAFRFWTAWFEGNLEVTFSNADPLRAVEQLVATLATRGVPNLVRDNKRSFSDRHVFLIEDETVQRQWERTGATVT